MARIGAIYMKKYAKYYSTQISVQRTAFLLLASTGMRIGALSTIKIRDLERIDDLYKITVYSGDNEEYFSFCTPE